MTYTARELVALGREVDPRAVEMRRWRRAHCLTQPEMAAVLGVRSYTYGRVEVGWVKMPKPWGPLLEQLYARWTDTDLPATARARKARRQR